MDNNDGLLVGALALGAGGLLLAQRSTRTVTTTTPTRSYALAPPPVFLRFNESMSGSASGMVNGAFTGFNSTNDFRQCGAIAAPTSRIRQAQLRVRFWRPSSPIGSEDYFQYTPYVVGLSGVIGPLCDPLIIDAAAIAQLPAGQSFADITSAWLDLDTDTVEGGLLPVGASVTISRTYSVVDGPKVTAGWLALTIR